MKNVIVRSERQGTRAERLEKLHVALVMIGSGMIGDQRTDVGGRGEMVLTQRREDAEIFRQDDKSDIIGSA